MVPYELQTGDDLSAIAVGMTLEEVERANPNMPIKNWWREAIKWNEAGAVVWIATGGTPVVLPDPLLISDGTAAAPSLAFTADSDTGIYRAGTNEIGFTAGGVELLSVGSADVDVVTGHLNVFSNTGSDTISLGEYSGGSNLAAIETSSFYALMGTGNGNDAAYIRTKGTGPLILGASHGSNLTIATGGAITLSSDLTVGGDVIASDGSATAPSLTFASDGDTGVFLPAANQLGFAAGGVELLRVGSADVDVMTGHLNLVSNTGAQTMSLGEWSSGYDYAAVETPSMVVLMGNALDVNSQGFIRTKGTGSLNLGTNNSNDLTIANGGNVGIGTTSPAQTLEVSGSAAVTSKMVVGASSFTQEPWSSSTIALGSFGSIGTQGSYATSLAWNYERGTDSGFHSLGVNGYTSAGGIDVTDAGIYFRSEGSGYAATAQPAIRMTLTSAGNVGIGTTTPNQKLYVSGNTTVTGRIYNGVGTLGYPSYTFDGDTNTGIFRKANGELGISCNGVQHYFSTAGLYLASGDWFRTTGSAGWYNQTYACGLYSTQATWVSTYGSGSGLIALSTVLLAAPANRTYSSGSLGVRRETTYGTLVTYSSTRDYKENVQSIDPAESGRIIDKLRPVTYNEKFRSGPDGTFVKGVADLTNETEDQRKLREWDTEYGFIAEELDALEPEGVKLASYDWQEIDDEGFPKPAGWKEGNVTAILVAEVKELRKRLAVLENSQ